VTVAKPVVAAAIIDPVVVVPEAVMLPAEAEAVTVPLVTGASLISSRSS